MRRNNLPVELLVVLLGAVISHLTVLSLVTRSDTPLGDASGLVVRFVHVGPGVAALHPPGGRLPIAVRSGTELQASDGLLGTLKGRWPLREITVIVELERDGVVIASGRVVSRRPTLRVVGEGLRLAGP